MLRVLWSEDASVAIMIALFRTMIVPITLCWPPAIATTITVNLPEVRGLIAATQGAVSYTHLDVYKRQHLGKWF